MFDTLAGENLSGKNPETMTQLSRKSPIMQRKKEVVILAFEQCERRLRSSSSRAAASPNHRRWRPFKNQNLQRSAWENEIEQADTDPKDGFTF